MVGQPSAHACSDFGYLSPREIVIRGRGDENVKGRIESGRHPLAYLSYHMSLVPKSLKESMNAEGYVNGKWELGLSQWARALVSYLAVVSDLNRDSTTMHKLPE